MLQRKISNCLVILVRRKPGCPAHAERPYMKRIIIAIAVTALVPCTASGKDKAIHPQHASVSAYKPLQGFTHTIGGRYFVGFFVATQKRCAVTVVDATVGDDRSFDGPRRQKFELEFGARAEIKADHGKALGIGCSADANEITVVALEPNIPESASR